MSERLLRTCSPGMTYPLDRQGIFRADVSRVIGVEDLVFISKRACTEMYVSSGVRSAGLRVCVRRIPLQKTELNGLNYEAVYEPAIT